MPPQDENTDWKELIVQMAIDYALPVAGDVITGLISNQFNPQQSNMELMFKNAIEEVCQRVNEIVEDNLLRQYLSDCSHISNQLYVYGQTQDKTVIENVQIESSRPAMRLSDLGQKAAGGFFLASNFHLISLRSLSIIDNSYTGTLKELTRRYYEIGNELNSGLNNTAKSLEPGECEIMRYPTASSPDLAQRYYMLTGNPLPTDSADVNTVVLKYGNENKFFSHTEGESPYILTIDTEFTELAKGRCERFKTQLYDDKVRPIYDIVERTTAVADKWNHWEV
ncbi:hypothetical protein [Bacillus thuringiensis]|uniref:hypothetical protein n=1 Tax=Bacillus thuringiensis TaxID=1428 RepID=UPI000BF69CDF|nr:hypothetical protein [Bacillus thuringiensis]PFU61934.1 hypothetical protein COK85_09940 [Bacillus thuringiensis]